MKNIERHTETLRTIAQGIDPVRNSRISAGIVFKGKLVSVGFCKFKSHPLQAKFGKTDESIFLHAEVDAIINALRNNFDVDNFRKSVLIVVRQKRPNWKSKKWIDGLAKPCCGCQKAIMHYDIGDVIWTENDD